MKNTNNIRLERVENGVIIYEYDPHSTIAGQVRVYESKASFLVALEQFFDGEAIGND